MNKKQKEEIDNLFVDKPTKTLKEMIINIVSDNIDEINTFISTITNRYKNIGDHPMITVISCEKYDELYIFMLMHDINIETLDFKYDKIIINTNITENCYNESKYMNDLYDIMIEVWKKFVLYR